MRLLLGIPLLVACTPTPSAAPLGWGPLAPGMRADPAVAAMHHTPMKSAKSSHATKPADSATAAVTVPVPADSARPSTEPAPKTGGKPKTEVTVAAFLGDYSGEDVAVYHIEELPDRTEKDPKARLKVTSSSDSALAFELVDSSNGNEICTLNGTLGPTGATIAKDQKCFEQNGEDASAAAKIVSGTATVEQTRLLFDLDMSFAMEMGGKKLGGTLSYHFDGKRK
ncbi:MAG TPA: hypothetical protein VH062_17900 [Polyangiaceae bacterium]|jgi:hypothetical protein|nr:hypothetical protein [Polyangiaceae bacterium]